MPPKKSRASLLEAQEAERKQIERQKQLAEERERNLKKIDLESREQSLRDAILVDSVKYFEHFLREIRQRKKQLHANDDWYRTLPDTDVPAEVRDFIYKWQLGLSEHWNSQVNWWVKCDERSLLTQDLEQKDTRRVTMNKQREPIGKFYDRMMRLMIKVYNSLLESLRRKKMTNTRYEDLITIRDEMRSMMLNFLDVLTFQVTLNIDYEMTSMNPITASYNYSSPDYRKSVWTFKDVPLPPTYNNFKRIQMESLNIALTVSKLFDLEESVIRGLWFKHDFLTDFCPSYVSPCETQFIDLRTSVRNEMKIKQSMIEEHKDAMRKVREVYDKKMEEKRIEQELLEKQNRGRKAVAKPKVVEQTKGKGKGSKKVPKEEVEPPIVDEATYINVDEEFVKFEDEHVETERESLLEKILDLNEHEVNMRRFQITNGVIKIESFERPLQAKQIDFKMFIRLNQKPHCIRYKHFENDFKIPIADDPRKSQSAKKLIDAREKALGDLFKVEIKINEKLLWFEVPNVCRWEPWEESDEFAALDPMTQDFNLNFEIYEKVENSKLFLNPDPRRCPKPIQLEDFDFKSPPEGVKRSSLIKDYLMPLMPVEYKFSDEQLQVYKKKQQEWKWILEGKKEFEAAHSESSNTNLTPFREDIRNVTLDSFHKAFDEKNSQPRNLFPVEHRKKIKVVEHPEIRENVEKARVDFKEQQIKLETEDVDIGIPRPVKDQPMLLSELVTDIDKVNESLRPDFTVKSQKLSIEMKPEKPARRTTRFTMFRENRASILRSTQKPAMLPALMTISRRIQSRSPSVRAKSKSPSSSTVESSMKTDVSTSEFNDQQISSKPLQNLIARHRGKWSTRDIHEQSYDAATKTVTFYTGRLGTFAFAINKYSELPLKNWELYSESGAVMIKITSQHISVEFKITSDGYTCIITNPRKSPFQGIDKPVKVNELKQILTSQNLNLFPEADASCYIQNISEKHKPMELHAYKSMAVYCLSHRFKSSAWNRRAHRRIAIFESRMNDKEVSKLLMATPMRTASVNVSESEITNVNFTMDPLDQEFHPDLLNFLKNDVDKREHRANLRNFMLLWYVQALLMNIQPLSFSQ